jgi:hypothetical protein
MKNSLLLLLAFSLFSCSKPLHEESENILFPNQVDLLGRTIMEDEITVNRLHAIDTLLLAELRGDSHLFAVYHPKDYTQLFKFGVEGDGPDEFIYPLYFTEFTIENGDYVIWLYELNRFQLHKVNLSQSLDRVALLIEETIPLSQKAIFSTAFYLNPTKVIGTVSNMDIKMGRMRLYDPTQDKIMKTVENFPDIEKKSDDYVYLYYRHNLLYVGFPVLHPERDKVAVSLASLNRIDVFDTQLNLLHFVAYSPPNEKSVIDDYLSTEPGSESELQIYYSGIFGTKDFIYALYIDQLERERDIEKPVEIRVFDWDLHPIGVYKIPDYIANFTVDERRGKIYGVKSRTDNAILEYDFQKF